MSLRSANPFEVTKAVDFSDVEIAEQWVDFPGAGGFDALLHPTQAMPTLVIGGKGSGRTHLLRYHSFALQRLRASNRAIHESIASEGFFGVFFRCTGLDAGRFAGSSASSEQWSAAFAYYFDLFLAALTLSNVAELKSSDPSAILDERALCGAIRDLFDSDDLPHIESIEDWRSTFATLRREVDFAVNNAVFRRRLELPAIRATRGNLVFGIPQALAKFLRGFQSVRFLYIIDELENLSEQHQRYVNTLVRERQDPTSFWVSSRAYGVRTYRTLSADEENRVGSEFHRVVLDEHLRQGDFEAFGSQLIARRLLASRFLESRTRFYSLLDAGADGSAAAGELGRVIGEFFESTDTGGLALEATRFVSENYEPAKRPYLETLRSKIASALSRGLAPGLSSAGDIERVVSALRIPEAPIIERLNVFMLYRAWARRRSLMVASQEIGEGARTFLLSSASALEHGRLLGHFRADLLAQLARECRQRTIQSYVGLPTFAAMAAGNPRHLLTLLRYIFQWSEFRGENPFAHGRISRSSQNEGVLQASNWFFEQAKSVGSRAERVQQATDRLGSFFKLLRFTDKPVESSLITFAFVLHGLSQDARSTLIDAEDNAVVIRNPAGHRDRNSGEVVEKFYLNPMLSPRYALPIASRGTVELSSQEIEAIFGETSRERFIAVASARARRMTAPFAEEDGTTDGESLFDGGTDARDPQQDLFA